MLLLGACATYSPHPLVDAPAVLDAPTSAALNAAAAKIERPYLAPTTIDLAAPLDSNAVATIAVIANPDLKALRAKAGLSDAQVFAARLIPDPTFSAGVHPILSGPDPFTELVATLGLDINALRTRGVKMQQARAQAEQGRLDIAWAEWQTAGQARIQATKVLGLDEVVAFDRKTALVQQALLKNTLDALGRGDISADQAQAARTAAYDAADKLRTDESELATARSELNKLLGLPPSTSLQLTEPTLPALSLNPAALFALLSRLAARVTSIEIIQVLANTARRTIEGLNLGNVTLRHGDGFAGAADRGPFDSIIVAAGTDEIPPPLLDQLKIGGRIVIPIGSTWANEQILVVTKEASSTYTRSSLGWTMFVPLTGRGQRPENAKGLFERDLPYYYGKPVVSPELILEFSPPDAFIVFGNHTSVD